jgi:hypothetical protein
MWDHLGFQYQRDVWRARDGRVRIGGGPQQNVAGNHARDGR